jgi:hypothetical protein
MCLTFCFPLMWESQIHMIIFRVHMANTRRCFQLKILKVVTYLKVVFQYRIMFEDFRDKGTFFCLPQSCKHKAHETV